MENGALEDWAFGISEPLRHLTTVGANDEELGRFIQARLLGDSDLANRILGTPRPSRSAKEASDLGAVLDGVLDQVRVAALKPVVNKMDARMLHRYMQCVWHVSERIVRTHRYESFWAIEAAVAAVAGVVMKFSLDQQSAIVELQFPPNAPNTGRR